ncbi:uncharacterized protein LOC119388889 [Rhipicephalus sanguineus]|uniref:uncharacterized protein LOC119388889 n=1 Tax=Rhipicephalus sanguineus TaxID=34632 RepID=UPI001895C51D|nr:uncharacterized protein LOC119388889 [Rhipicephalus sanguineus]
MSLMACMVILTLFIMIVFVVMSLGYGLQQAETTSPLLPKFEDFVLSDKLKNRSSQRITTGHPGKWTEAPTGKPAAGSYWVKFAMHPTADAFPWMEGCTTPACLAIRHRLLGAIEPFMNPCRNLNFFSCSIGDRRALIEQEEENLEEASVPETDTSGQSFWAPQRLVRGRAPRIQAGGQALRDIMIHQCNLYSESLRDSLEVVEKVTGYFKLYYPNVTDDSKEEPVARMLQLSLEYGLHPIVSFVRRFRYTRDPSEPFELRIDITERAKHYFRYWSERDSAWLL